MVHNIILARPTEIDIQYISGWWMAQEKTTAFVEKRRVKECGQATDPKQTTDKHGDERDHGMMMLMMV